jgi:hypothetical protein
MCTWIVVQFAETTLNSRSTPNKLQVLYQVGSRVQVAIRVASTRVRS